MKQSKAFIISGMLGLVMLVLSYVQAYHLAPRGETQADRSQDLYSAMPKLIINDNWVLNTEPPSPVSTSFLDGNYQINSIINPDLVAERDKTQVINSSVPVHQLMKTPVRIQPKQIYLQPASSYEFHDEDYSNKDIERKELYALTTENNYAIVKKKKYRSSRKRFPPGESSKRQSNNSSLKNKMLLYS